MREITMADLASHVEAAKKRLGIIDDAAWNDRLRNPGTRRAPAKRAALAAIDEAAREAGREPLKHNY